MDDQNLLLLVKNIILFDKIINIDTGKWKQFKARVFVTAYKVPNNTTSSNVWCCMSSGSPNNSVHDNVIASSKVCKTSDPRVTQNLPQEFHITVLLENKRRHIDWPTNKNTTTYIETDSGSAYFLPTVWDEFKSVNDYVEALRLKASNNNPNSKIRAIYEIPVIEVGSPIFQDVARRCLPFYLNNAKYFNDSAILAYQIINNKPIYNNDGYWVRSYSDVLALYKLSPSNAVKFVNTILRNDTNWQLDIQTMAARLELLIAVYPNSSEISIISQNLLHARISPGLYSKELSFANPQIVRVMTRIYGNKHNDITGFIQLLELKLPEILKQNGIFAANHIARAIPNPRYRYTKQIQKQLINVLKNNTSQSNTEEACAITGLIALKYYKTAADRLEKLSSKQLPNGGFVYGGSSSNLIRTDVTSHVVEGLYLLIKLSKTKRNSSTL